MHKHNTCTHARATCTHTHVHDVYMYMHKHNTCTCAHATCTNTSHAHMHNAQCIHVHVVNQQMLLLLLHDCHVCLCACLSICMYARLASMFACRFVCALHVSFSIMHIHMHACHVRHRLSVCLVCLYVKRGLCVNMYECLYVCRSVCLQACLSVRFSICGFGSAYFQQLLLFCLRESSSQQWMPQLMLNIQIEWLSHLLEEMRVSQMKMMMMMMTVDFQIHVAHRFQSLRLQGGS